MLRSPKLKNLDAFPSTVLVRDFEGKVVSNVSLGNIPLAR